MFPKNRRSLFAKQFIWKPFSFEHGHYTVDISASTGRFYEELYIEKVKDKWAFAAKVDDIDTHDTRYAYRDKLFPASLASQIIANHKCWPEMLQCELFGGWPGLSGQDRFGCPGSGVQNLGLDPAHVAAALRRRLRFACVAAVVWRRDVNQRMNICGKPEIEDTNALLRFALQYKIGGR